jgi:hypothetical protein
MRRRDFTDRDREKKIGAGHPFKLTLRGRLLCYLSTTVSSFSFTLLGYMFNLWQSNVLKNMWILEP